MVLSRSLRSSAPSTQSPARVLELLWLALVWVVVYCLSLASPALLDDADATHAQAAQAMLRNHDWVTLHVNGVRYLEKAPLPYWIAALSLHLFGPTSFAIHLPLALTVLGLALLAWKWASEAFDGTPEASMSTRSGRAGFYAGLFTLTATGVFLFTRIFIPDALLSFLLGFTLYAVVHALEAKPTASYAWAHAAWITLAAAVLTKGLVAPVFILSSVAIYLWLAREAHAWRRLHLGTGLPIFLAIAAPWHLLAGFRNRGGGNGHGFFWFYFVNEHVLRFLGRRSPPDYNKLPAALYWSLHLVWLFPWSVFLPLVGLCAWWRRDLLFSLRQGNPWPSFTLRSVLLLGIFSAVVLLFFSISTNQEYYTLPVYLPLLILTAGALRVYERGTDADLGTMRLHRIVLRSQAALCILCLIAAAALGFGLWSSRGLPAASNVGDLLAHRGVGRYTLSMSHFFDLTTASFSALRLPAALACGALALGPGLALWLRSTKRHLASTVVMALMSVTCLLAAHSSLNRFASMLSSADFAAEIQQLQRTGAISPGSEVLLYGDQAYGSSIPFYLGHPVQLVDGRSTSLLFGSTFPDAPKIFLSHDELSATWGTGRRKLLFVPLERRDEVERLLGDRRTLVYESSGKALFTDRPLGQQVQNPAP